MTDQFVNANKMVPITPPPELVQQWLGEYFGTTVTGEISDIEHALATQAARWGADQELEACCAWLDEHLAYENNVTDNLRAARRPKPPSLKEQALTVLDDASDRLDAAHENIIRRALEQLDD